LPLLQSGWSQQDVQTRSFVLSPIIKQPGSHSLEQLRETDHSCGADVAFIVKVYLLTVQEIWLSLHGVEKVDEFGARWTHSSSSMNDSHIWQDKRGGDVLTTD